MIIFTASWEPYTEKLIFGKDSGFVPVYRVIYNLLKTIHSVQVFYAGVFPYSPEEGTRAAKMERVDSDEAARRAERIVDIQSEIIDAWNDERQGDVMEVLCEGFDGQSMLFVGRSYAESPDIDGRIYFSAPRDVAAGEFVPVRITGAMDGELTGELAEE